VSHVRAAHHPARDPGLVEPRPGAPGKRAYDVFVDCFARGLLIRVTGDIVALSPPLILEHGQIGEIAQVLGDAIDRVA
jgi:beta-alanine--pyruvate transaminase